MEGEEGGESRMISWIWVLIAFVGGQVVGFICAAMCSGSWDAAEERAKERKMAEELGLIYPENKKAADAGTSTAAHEAQKGNLS